MNISPFLIYLWQQLDLVRSSLFSVTVISLIALVISVIILSCFAEDGKAGEDSKDFLFVVKLAKRFAWAALLAFFLRMFIPTSDTLAYMVVLPKIVESDVIQEDIPELYDHAVEALKNHLAPNLPKKEIE